MSVVFSQGSPGSRLLRLSGFPDMAQFSVSGWVTFRGSNPSPDGMMLAFTQERDGFPDNYSYPFVWLGYGFDATPAAYLDLQAAGGLGSDVYAYSPAVVEDTPYHFGIARALGGTTKFYWGGCLVAELTNSYDFVPDAMVMGEDQRNAGEDLDAEFSYLRIWSNVTLTQAQLRAEAVSTTPVITSGLFADYPFASDVLDASGNGRHWTASGAAISFASQPSITLGSCQSKRNFLTGQGHVVNGSDNRIAGRRNTVTGDVSEVHGADGTVTGNLSVLFNLDGTPYTVTGDGKFVVRGDVEITGTLTPGTMDLDALSDVTITTPQTNDGLTYDGAGWINQAPIMRYAEVAISSADILALRATPKTLVAAPGAGKIAEFAGLMLLLDATATAYVESAANLAVRYTNGSGAKVCEDIEATGFIDQTADTMTTGRPKLDAIVGKTGCENQPLVLHNLGAGEYTTGTGVMRAKVAYRVWSTNW